jgi:peptidoglycan/LPS O-acetylase OafA/YrhL
VGEYLGTGRVRLTAFWARRLRRLLPASSVTLGLVALSAIVTDEVWERSLRVDVIASALNVANWRFLFADASYAERFAAPSPVLHFWSLAIEEQFYWVFPLLAAGVLTWARGSLRALGGVLVGLLAVSAALTLLFSDSPDTVYYATPIRMGEILVGALLAVVVARGAVVGSRRWAPVIAVAGVAALVATFWAWWNLEESTSLLYDGGLLVYAAVSGALVLAACVPGPVKRLLSVEPLRSLGVISYGVYLIHWPVFLLLDEDRADQLLEPFDLHPRGAALLVIRLVPTLLLAVLSYWLLERPIRRGRRPRRFNASLLAGGTVVTVVLLAVSVPWILPPPADPFAQFMQVASGPDPDSLDPNARIGVTLGDSTMLMTAWGLSAWGTDNGRLVLPGGSAGVGCGIGRGGMVRYAGDQGQLDDECEGWAGKLPSEVARARDRYGHIEFAVVQTGPWDVADRRLDGEDQWRQIGDPVYDEYLRREFETANDILLREGLTVIWLTSPMIESGRDQNPRPERPYAESDPERMRRLNGLITQMAAGRPGVVVVDLAAFIDEQPRSEDVRLRPDGVHFTEETSTEVAAAWRGEQVLAAIDREVVPEPVAVGEPASEPAAPPEPAPQP